jgi:hypothetical protein
LINVQHLQKNPQNNIDKHFQGLECNDEEF